MSKLSTQVENQVRISRKVIASAKTHAHAAAVAIGAVLAGNESAKSTPEPEVSTAAKTKAAKAKAAEKKPAKSDSNKEPSSAAGAAEIATSYEHIFRELAGSLEGATETLMARELEYTAEQADDGPIRDARDAKVKYGITVLSRLRTAVEDTLGTSALRTYGLQQETPRVPRAVMTQAQNVGKLLRKTPASIKTDFGSTFDTAAAAKTLETLHEELTGLINDEDREERELQDAYAKRNRAQEAWSRTYQGVATTLEGLYLFAGLPELADRVRPTQRTLRGEDAGEPDTGTAPTAPDATNEKNSGPIGG